MLKAPTLPSAKLLLRQLGPAEGLGVEVRPWGWKQTCQRNSEGWKSRMAKWGGGTGAKRWAQSGDTEDQRLVSQAKGSWHCKG